MTLITSYSIEKIRSWCCLLVFLFSLKINEPIQSFQAGVYFFQLLLKIPMIQLNNRFEFHRFWALDIQSILEVLQITHDFLASGNKVRSSVYIFHVVSVRDLTLAEWHSASVPLLRIEERVRFPCSPGHCGH